MSRKLTILLTASALLALAQPTSGLQETLRNPELDQGITQVREGDFGGAIVTLDSVARRLASEGGHSDVLARTYVYLSIAYLGLSQVEAAKTQFLKALDTDKRLQLSPDEFPPRFMTFFQETMKEFDAAGNGHPEQSAAPIAPKPVPPTKTADDGNRQHPRKTTGGSKGLFIGLGGAAVVGAAVAVATAGNGRDSTPETPANTTPPRTLTTGDIRVIATSPQGGATVECTDVVNVTISVTNNHASETVGISRLQGMATVVSGVCTPGTQGTFPVFQSQVAPQSTAVVYSGPFYGTFTGCCQGACFGNTCTFGLVIDVLTSVGSVRANAINHNTRFVGCELCASFAAAQRVPGASCR